MIKFFVILLFLLSSCAYPDIDTVPDFKDVIITDEESIDLCKIDNSDNEQITKCLEKIDKEKFNNE